MPVKQMSEEMQMKRVEKTEVRSRSVWGLCTGVCMGMAALMMASAPQAQARVGDLFTVDGLSYKVTWESGNSGTVTLYKCSKTAGLVDIPAVVTPGAVTYQVTEIASDTFRYCDSLVGITIPATVASIGANAFQSCTSLLTMEIPASVTYIGSSAFFGCSRMMTIYFRGNAPETGLDIFKRCESLSVVYYAEGTTGWTNPWQKIPTAPWTPEQEEVSLQVDSMKQYDTKGKLVGFLITFPYGGKLETSTDRKTWTQVQDVVGLSYFVNIQNDKGTDRRYFRLNLTKTQ